MDNVNYSGRKQISDGWRWGDMKRRNYEWAGGNFRGDKYVHYFENGDGFMGIYMCKIYQIVHVTYLQYTV